MTTAARAVSQDMSEGVRDNVDGHAASLTLEAMRLGVVPDADIDAYTVGRQAEIDAVDADLGRVRQQGGAIRAFLGEYGTGKTHLLELIRERALSQNFVTARVVLDPEETAPSHPKRVYRQLIRSLEYPDRSVSDNRGLGPLFEQAAEDQPLLEQFHIEESVKARKVLDEGAHLYLTPALRYFRAIGLGEDNGRRRAVPELSDDERDYGLTLLFNWLEGHPTISNQDIDDILRKMVGRQGRIFSMMDYRPWPRIYGYILSGLASMIRQVGYAGLVVLIDEAEFYSLLSSQNREYAEIWFKSLAWASIGDEETPVPFSRDDLDLGGYGILQDLPPRYGRDSGLYTVFAMTPNAEGKEALQSAVPKDQIAELSRLEMDDYRLLATEVASHYRRARADADIGDKMEGALCKLVSGLLHSGYIENPRQAMKFVVEFLDLSTFRRDQMPEVIQQLRQMYGR